MNAPLRSEVTDVAAFEGVARSGRRPHLELTSPVPERQAPQDSRKPQSRPGAAQLAMVAVAALIAWGLGFPTEQYITPRTGLGYALGIAGGSAMLLLLVYPLRKRLRFLAFLGTTRRWFQAHMALGIVGPLLILFHSNFSLGATNSNVALACMLVVSGSGLFGRYFYARIHHGLHGRRANLAELKLYADKLRSVTASVDFLPGLVERIDAEERALVERCDRAWLLMRPALGALRSASARRRLHHFVRESLRGPAGAGADTAERQQRLDAVAMRYVDDRLGAIRRVVEFDAFERLFSLWHALHMPLFLMLLVAGLVHVAAVHLY